MPMSNAERQRKYRERRDQDIEKRQAYLNKEKTRYVEDKVSGRKKGVKDMTEREKRTKRKQWKEQKRKVRAELKAIQNVSAASESTCNSSISAEIEMTPDTSRQKVKSLKKKSRDKAKCYRDNITLQKELKLQKRKMEMYRKRWLRAKSKKSKDSPRTKTRFLMRNFSTKAVRRTLTFHNALITQLKESYQASAGRRDKQRLSQILSGSVLRKYKMKCMAFRVCGIRSNVFEENRYRRMTPRHRQVQDFYLRDDNSRLTAGIKRTVTLKKVKKQRRILKDSIKHLYMKYCCETPSYVSYTTF